MLCSVAASGVMLQTLRDLQSKKNSHGEKQPDTLCFPQGLLAGRELHRRSTHCCCGTPLLLDCCWKYLHAYIWSQSVC